MARQQKGRTTPECAAPKSCAAASVSLSRQLKRGTLKEVLGFPAFTSTVANGSRLPDPNRLRT